MMMTTIKKLIANLIKVQSLPKSLKTIIKMAIFLSIRKMERRKSLFLRKKLH